MKLAMNLAAACVFLSWLLLSEASKLRQTEQRAIPNRLLFNYKQSLLSNPSALPLHAANVQKLISKYHDMEVEFLDDAGCAQTIARAHSESLASYYQSEDFGPYKSDVCRLAQLLENGGYYLDNDLEFVSDFRDAIPVDASFVSVAHPNKDIFQAFTAASPGHPLIKQTLDGMHKAYQMGQAVMLFALNSNATVKSAKELWFGPNAIAASWRAFSGEPVNVGKFHHANHTGFQTSYMFLEANVARFGLASRIGGGCCCNYAVGDASGRAIFYSRFVGASDFCTVR
eukprot:TRINITY_DN94046_c0_g1_i1.p1 TRINITY_DN94046_c0_g1~~TRINITY_DN94046_c0_g1_i1.p1  ORF type:complete len:285 (-),score=52.68 TRINITY_DN94046_c0_g1_i1:147-1001(-)